MFSLFSKEEITRMIVIQWKKVLNLQFKTCCRIKIYKMVLKVAFNNSCLSDYNLILALLIMNSYVQIC